MNILKRLLMICLITFFSVGTFSPAFASEPEVSKRKTFTLWQLPPRTPTQNMAYVIRTINGKIIVVDGGNHGDAEYLQGFLAPLGNHVHAWFISHAHSDHVDALIKILNNPGYLQIDHVYGSLNDEAWVKKNEPQYVETTKKIYQALKKYRLELTELSQKQIMEIDGLKIQILGVKNPEIKSNAINNSSIIFRISDNHKSVLFTGDMGVQGGQKLLKSELGNQLESDYIQMAHHGQNGVDEDFYKAVKPRFCLWPTPAWLWNNDIGKGINSGTWQTLIVRDWMDRLKVERHYLSAEGLIQID